MNEEMLYELKCEICGKYKPLSEFSKSYPKRCKACVAEQMRLSRKEKKMQPTIKAEIDWEQRRYEIAKDIMAAFLSNSNVAVHGDSAEEHASDAVLYADALIAELKKGYNQ